MTCGIRRRGSSLQQARPGTPASGAPAHSAASKSAEESDVCWCTHLL